MTYSTGGSSGCDWLIVLLSAKSLGYKMKITNVYILFTPSEKLPPRFPHTHPPVFHFHSTQHDTTDATMKIHVPNRFPSIDSSNRSNAHHTIHVDFASSSRFNGATHNSRTNNQPKYNRTSYTNSIHLSIHIFFEKERYFLGLFFFFVDFCVPFYCSLVDVRELRVFSERR